ncbi:hypothetical protein H257_02050 [Aphanomyces astaci]|uniref:Uncharacterized protein n=1 Tax=Aphanomyces astaci TaxID=112090 RepID=W4H4V4_APHAT|nr:hypothetical protein H257_02050 [Aphanomyces astaci]ETV87040.1 hypothetical protein H257_02050 [Aphanomyces astaci]|eukprot:XP_009823839.1 hypothetical protein H257_02050 [Aphanomyces astaci]
MTDKFTFESSTKLKADGSTAYRIAPGVYASDRNEADDLVALSYIQLSIHGDHLKYTHASSKTYQTWEALRAIYEAHPK